MIRQAGWNVDRPPGLSRVECFQHPSAASRAASPAADGAPGPLTGWWEGARGSSPPDAPSDTARLIEEFRHQGQRARLAHALRAQAVELTRRQWDVLELLAEGLTTAQIAAILSIAEATVRSHVATVLRKLRVSTRAGAADLLQGAFRSLNAQ
jgi:DNA-binding CsgD family transcriptional regulator